MILLETDWFFLRQSQKPLKGSGPQAKEHWCWPWLKSLKSHKIFEFQSSLNFWKSSTKRWLSNTTISTNFSWTGCQAFLYTNTQKSKGIYEENAMFTAMLYLESKRKGLFSLYECKKQKEVEMTTTPQSFFSIRNIHTKNSYMFLTQKALNSY